MEESQGGTEAGTWSRNQVGMALACSIVRLGSYSASFLIIQTRPACPGDGTVHSGLTSPVSIKDEQSSSQTCPQTKQIKKNHVIEPFQVILGCFKVTVNAN